MRNIAPFLYLINLKTLPNFLPNGFNVSKNFSKSDLSKDSGSISILVIPSKFRYGEGRKVLPCEEESGTGSAAEGRGGKETAGFREGSDCAGSNGAGGDQPEFFL